jgi:hypothetical protein
VNRARGLAWALLLGCAGPPPRLADPPPTARDPQPLDAPRGPTEVEASRAERLVLELLESVLRLDRAGAERLFAPRLALVRTAGPGGPHQLGRSDALEQLWRGTSEVSTWPRDGEVEVTHLRRASEAWPLIPGLGREDLEVRFEVSESLRPLARNVPRTLWVRLGERALILGY